MKQALILVATCAVLLITACDPKMSGRISTLEVENEAGKVKIADLYKRLLGAELKIWVLEATKNLYASATFDPAEATAYQRVDTIVGPLTISVDDVKPHADGVRVRLNVGNVTTAKFNGGLFKIKWGSRFEKGTNYREWLGTMREAEHKFTNDLSPGTWNKVTLTLPGVPPEKFGYLELSVETDQITLHMPGK